ncbi:hypothetical protein DT076_18130 [Desertihabitans brevis]|uniref:Glycosyltransferase RgtA/B/C/D-like domain-containing protein n=1 Tax=Desertihabitans brevis TaxID=2268447 RepID=A0A367YSY6_9ACTN|nr:hypothetical protein [Desertihabitans brevis]RCK68101.1 hypothetical protein DT076_18130 [Desertihabitans brevis]
MSTLLARLDALLRPRAAWAVVCAVVLAVQGAFMLLLSAPGRANVDVVYQARQALGEVPYNDWHPPVMSALWELLIDLTGDVGSLFRLQTGVLLLTVWASVLLVHRATGHRRWTLWLLLLPLAPWVLGQTAVLWKDTQMAVALLAGCLCLFFIDVRRRRTWILVLPALVLLSYATAVRKNAVFALVPIAVYLGVLLAQVVWKRFYRAGDGRRWVRLTAASLVALLVLGASSSLLDRGVTAAKEVQPTSSLATVMLDDVTFSVPEAELRASDAPPELVERILGSRARCREIDEAWDSYLHCFGRGGAELFAPVEDAEAIQELWVEHVLPHPVRYLIYRSGVFSYYFFSSALEWWPYGWRGDAETVGLGPQNYNADVIARYYVVDFAAETFPMLFKPWFWSALGIACVVLSRRAGRRLQGPVLALAWSALAYVAGYLPIAPANHFRYTFWPALAVSVALGMLCAGWWARHRRTSLRRVEPDAVRTDGHAERAATPGGEPT